MNKGDMPSILFYTVLSLLNLKYSITFYFLLYVLNKRSDPLPAHHLLHSHTSLVINEHSCVCFLSDIDQSPHIAIVSGFAMMHRPPPPTHQRTHNTPVVL